MNKLKIKDSKTLIFILLYDLWKLSQEHESHNL